jgi:hypothetical protein
MTRRTSPTRQTVSLCYMPPIEGSLTSTAQPPIPYLLPMSLVYFVTVYQVCTQLSRPLWERAGVRG